MAYADVNREKCLAYYHANKHTERAKEWRRRHNEKRRAARAKPAKDDISPMLKKFREESACL